MNSALAIARANQTFWQRWTPCSSNRHRKVVLFGGT
jgi:hypothetical protein